MGTGGLPGPAGHRCLCPGDPGLHPHPSTGNRPRGLGDHGALIAAGWALGNERATPTQRGGHCRPNGWLSTPTRRGGDPRLSRGPAHLLRVRGFQFLGLCCAKQKTCTHGLSGHREKIPGPCPCGTARVSISALARLPWIGSGRHPLRVGVDNPLRVGVDNQPFGRQCPLRVGVDNQPFGRQCPLRVGAARSFPNAQPPAISAP